MAQKWVEMNSLSIIIICHNNYYIDHVINAVKKQIKDTDEIILVDDCSTESIKELINNSNNNITLLQTDICGNRSYNRNLAATHAKKDILVFVDGDVLVENLALEKIRLQNFNNISGLCGNVAAMQIEPEEASIVLKDYYNHFDWLDERNFDLLHNVFPDSRIGMHVLPWNRFYSALCAIPKSVFYSAGFFDENLIGWGGEDIDLGYRLSFLGKLTFNSDIRCVHIPHPRNNYQNEIESRKNMYEMLKKYRNKDMEELLSFACLDRAHEALNVVLCEMRKKEDPFDFKADKNSELRLSVVSSLHMNGSISYMSEGKIKQESFLGLALPFTDFYFNKSVSDTRLFRYPVGLTARIMQELLRVSSSLIIEKVDCPLEILWDDIEEKFKYIFCYYKIKQFCDSYSDFNIKDIGDSFLITLKNKH